MASVEDGVFLLFLTYLLVRVPQAEKPCEHPNEMTLPYKHSWGTTE